MNLKFVDAGVMTTFKHTQKLQVRYLRNLSSIRLELYLSRACER